MRRLPLLLLAGVAACDQPTPPPPTAALAPTADTVIVPVSSIANVVPLADGRWVALAPEESQVLIVDFGSKSSLPFPEMSRAEVPGATNLFEVGDTIMVGDWGLRRTTGWIPGQPRLAAWPSPDALHGALPRARDAAGQWYFQITPNPGRDGSGLRDSAAVVRSDPLMTTFDTVARLAPPDLASVDAGTGISRVEARVLSGVDRWGVEPDGTLWIARVGQNQVEWHPVGGTRPVRSRMLPDPVLQVSQMDKELYIRSFPVEQQPAVRQMARFAIIKPPFERVLTAPDHRLWLFKSAPALDSVRTFQIVDQQRGLLQVVKVPSRGIALGLSGESVVMGERFPGGVRLLRYRLKDGLMGDRLAPTSAP